MALDPIPEANNLVNRLNEFADGNNPDLDIEHNLQMLLKVIQEIPNQAQKDEILARLHLPKPGFLEHYPQISSLFQAILRYLPIQSNLPAHTEHSEASIDQSADYLKSVFPGASVDSSSSTSSEDNFVLNDAERNFVQRSEVIREDHLKSSGLTVEFQAIDQLDPLFRAQSAKEFQSAVKGLAPSIRSLFENINLYQEDSYFTFRVAVEQAKHRLTSLHIFQSQATRFLTQNQEQLLNLLQEKRLIPFDTSSGVTITCCPLSDLNTQETHNRGKTPLLVTIQSSQGDEVRFVLKPRSAQMEKKVLDLCRELNEYCVFKKHLPQYHIFPFLKDGSNWNWSSCNFLGDFSLWEYVDGTNLRDLGCSPHRPMEQFINNAKWLKKDEKKALTEKLKTTQSLLRRIRVKDLHSENFMMQGVRLCQDLSEERKQAIAIAIHLSEKNIQLSRSDDLTITSPLDILPIDLECVDVSSPISQSSKTQFETRLSIPPAANKLIEQFDEDASNMPVRYIVLGTQSLVVRIADFTQLDLLTQEITGQLSKKFTTVHRDRIKKFLELDYFYKDVPYFTLLDGQVYHGNEPLEDHIIAEGLKN